jgi:hypothetical protein
VSRHRGTTPADSGPPSPPVPGALCRPGVQVRTAVRVLAWTLAGAVALSACASKTPKPTPASLEVDAVRQVLDGMAEGLEARDATALASQWDSDAREDARARIRSALDAGAAANGPVDLRLTPVAVRAKGRRRLVRVAWEGTWGGRKVAGMFEMELTDGEPPAIVAIRGDDPVAGPASAATVPGALEEPVP